MNDNRIYEDIALRTGGDIYIGVVGPVRTGKSTFIKRFMDTLVIPNIDNTYVRERAKDELPQSGSGKTVMTAEPKFVPEDAVEISLDGTSSFSVRLIDCVGYMVPGAAGIFEGDRERLVTTPWFDHEIPISEAAEAGTKKVITDHSTIGIVITTDGTVTDIPREDYMEAEERVVRELKALGKPFLVIVNSAEPENALQLAGELAEKYGVTCIAKNCLTLEAGDITEITGSILSEFPVAQLGLFLPEWLEAMPLTSQVKANLFEAILAASDGVYKIRDIAGFATAVSSSSGVSHADIREINMGSGVCSVNIEVPKSLFYTTVSESTGLDITDDKTLIAVLTELAEIKAEFDRIAPALESVRDTGYGVILPSADEMTLEEPEVVRRGGRYGVRLKASAPSIHLLKAEIETEVSPAVGGAGASEDIISLLLQEFEGDTSRIWESNLFGKSLYDIAGEDLMVKMQKMPEDTQRKLRNTLQRIINEGSGGIICIIL